MNVFKSGLSSFVYHILGSFFTLVFQFGSAKLLSTEEFGKANYMIGMVNSIAIIFMFGISYYFPKKIHESTNKNTLFSNVFYSTTLIYIIFSVVFFYFFKDKFENIGVFVLFLFVTWGVINVGYIKSFYIGSSRADLASKIANFDVKIIIVVFFSLLFYCFRIRTYESYLLSIMFSNVLVIYFFLKKTLTSISFDFSFLKHASIFYFIQLLYSFFSEYSKVLQGDYYNMNSVALLSISLIISGVITIFGENFANVGLPLFAAAYHKKKYSLMKLKFQEISRVNALFVIPLIVLVFVFSCEILSIFGSDYTVGGLMLKLILIGAFVSSFTGPNGSLLLMCGNEKMELFNGICKIITFIFISYIFGDKYIWGIALGLSVSEVVVNLLKTIEVYLKFKILPLKFKEFIFVIFIFVLCMCVFMFIKFVFMSVYMKLGCSIFILFIVWLLSFYLSPNVRDKIVLMKNLKIIKNAIC